jgi:hypothetical protein
MRKRIVAVQHDNLPGDQGWLALDDLAEIELTSEDPLYPIESAFFAGEGPGWRAAEPGAQTIRLIFTEPRQINKIYLVFTEFDVDRSQEYVLRWAKDIGSPFEEIVRQQWNFSPEGANTETEDHRVELSGVKVLELMITPDINDKNAIAALKKLRVA